MEENTKVIRRKFLHSAGAAIGIGAISNSASADDELSWQSTLLGKCNFAEIKVTHDSPVHSTKKIPIDNYGVAGGELRLISAKEDMKDKILKNNRIVNVNGFRPLPAQVNATPSSSVVVERNAGLKPTAMLRVVSGYTPPSFKVLGENDDRVIVESDIQTVTVPNGEERHLELPAQTVEIPGRAPSNPSPLDGIDVQKKINKETNDRMLDDERHRNATEEVRITPVLNIRNHGVVDIVDYKIGGGQ